MLENIYYKDFNKGFGSDNQTNLNHFFDFKAVSVDKDERARVFRDYCYRFPDCFSDEGEVLRNEVKTKLFHNIISKNEVIDFFRLWVSSQSYMYLKKKTEFVSDARLDAVVEDVFVPVVKRGDPNYEKLLKQRLSCIRFDDLEKKYGVKIRNGKTNVVFLTLTYDTKRCDFIDAWLNISNEWNVYITYLRERFGKVDAIKVFESFENGYPHIHCLLFFSEKEFTYFRDKKGKVRLYAKKEFEKGWHSFVDVFGSSSLKLDVPHLFKYISKTAKADNKKSLLSLAMLWLFRKHGFSLSKDIQELQGDFADEFITSKGNSKCFRVFQQLVTGDLVECLVSYVFVGIVGASQVPYDQHIPPPDSVFFG